MFADAAPAGATVSGLGTNVFTWGFPIYFGGVPSSFTFVPAAAALPTSGGFFSLGTLVYHNGQTWLGSEATSVQFDLTIDVGGSPSTHVAADVPITIATTRNSGDPRADGDFITFPDGAAFSETVIMHDGSRYLLQVFGFGTLYDTEAYLPATEVHIDEDTSLTLTLVGGLSKPDGLDPSRQIIGLGDSVAAGYGAGVDDGVLSYPMQVLAKWGTKHGYTASNLAVTGSISGRCTEHCEVACRDRADNAQCNERCLYGSENPPSERCHSLGADQLQKALDAHPKIVTITVGANDIDFAACLEQWFGNDIVNDPTANDCSVTNPRFRDKLDLLRGNLDAIFSALTGTNAEVFVSQYYNPFPDGAGSLCKPFYVPLAVRQLVDNAVIVTPRRAKDVGVLLQQSTYSFVSATIGSLNQTIANAAAPYAHVHVVPLNFKGHDFCRSGSSAWAYGSAMHGWYTQTVGAFAVRFNFDKALPSACPNPAAFEAEPLFEYSGTAIDIRYLANCMPHPTGKGQDAIAKAFVKAIKRQGLN